ncbi:MAG TPA: ATP-binding protein [Pyrinomonadaceae bacterium]|nr:ATP-binding protein [Pyrinomonadaceae bacterium]
MASRISLGQQVVRIGGQVESLQKLELFTRTFENRFIFNLFDVLLCGIIVLVVLRGWRARTKNIPVSNQSLLLLAFSCLGASFAVQAIYSGAFVFFRQRLTENEFEFIFHVFQAAAWLLLATSTYQSPHTRQLTLKTFRNSVGILLPGAFLSTIDFAGLSPTLMAVLDVANLSLITLALIRIYRHPLGGRKFVSGALALIWIAAALHFAASLRWSSETSLLFWNAEQFGWSLSLITCALAMGETSRNLFDKVFVRLQITFILLASAMLLVITQTEKSDYYAGIRARADHLVEFVREHVDYLRQQNQSLADIIAQEDISKSIFGFGNLPELKVVRVVVDRQVATFEVDNQGKVTSRLDTTDANFPGRRFDTEDYFLIRALPLKVMPAGEIAFYGTREFLDEHIRRRIVVIFSLFTAMVALSTLMIGLVVRDASTTIREQGQEIVKTQEQLSQASKLAAIGELAAGVAHEINNPATTILSLSSFWASQNGDKAVAVDHEDLQEVMTQAQRIAKITSSLLEFSRPHVSEVGRVPLDRIIDLSLRMVDDLLSKNGISIEKTLPSHVPLVRGDEDSLVRALENIFRNAIDAMPHGGTLRLNVFSEQNSPNRISIKISDTGVGIEKDHLHRIFDPFFSTKDVGRGTGLGLSIVHGIVREHQGEITVESERGVGTKFIIVLPTEE